MIQYDDDDNENNKKNEFDLKVWCGYMVSVQELVLQSWRDVSVVTFHSAHYGFF